MLYGKIWSDKSTKIKPPAFAWAGKGYLCFAGFVFALLICYASWITAQYRSLRISQQEQGEVPTNHLHGDVADRQINQDDLLQEIADLHIEILQQQDWASEKDRLLQQKDLLLAKAETTSLLRDISLDLRSNKHREALDSLENAKQTLRERSLVLSQVPSGLPFAEDTDHWLSSSYGRRQHPVYKRWHFHKGADFGLRIGTPIQATADGIVSFVGNNGGYGKTVVINHRYGFKSYYGHLSKILVKHGQIVTKAQEIALSGNTGVSTGAHLHYEIRHLGKAIDPRNFYRWQIDSYQDFFAKQKNEPLNWEALIADLTKTKLADKSAQQLSFSELN